MIRYINIKHQAQLDARIYEQFSWWDTVRDTFLSFNGCQMWDSWEEFERDYSLSNDATEQELDRFGRLFPRKK